MKNKYIPPKSNKGENSDRGYNSDPKPQQQPKLSNQFPTTKPPKEVNGWWND